MKAGVHLCFLLIFTLVVANRHSGGHDRGGELGDRRKGEQERGKPDMPDGEDREFDHEEDGPDNHEPEDTDQDMMGHGEDEEETGHRGHHSGGRRRFMDMMGHGEDEEGTGHRGHHSGGRSRFMGMRGHGGEEEEGESAVGHRGRNVNGRRQFMRMQRGQRRHRPRPERMFHSWLRRHPHVLCTICAVLNNTEVKDATVKALTENNTCEENKKSAKIDEGPSINHSTGDSHMTPPDLRNATVVSSMYDRILKKICEPKRGRRNRRQ